MIASDWSSLNHFVGLRELSPGSEEDEWRHFEVAWTSGQSGIEQLATATPSGHERRVQQGSAECGRVGGHL